MMVLRGTVFLVGALLATLPAPADEAAVIASMDELRFQPPKEKGTLQSVPGKSGQAIQFHLDKDSASTFFTSNIHGTPAWDQADGFSFWVKGGGEDGFAGLEFIYEDDFAVRYDFCFPVKGTDWTKVTVAWSDLIPALPGPHARPLDPENGNPPSKLSALWFGRWWYWGDYPALTFTIDEIYLEPSIDRSNVAPLPESPPLGRVMAKLKAGKPITIVTMGDSLTDKRHWANRKVAWVDLLKSRLEAEYGSDVTIVNPAIGGTQLRQNLVLMPRWSERTPHPDLVTLFFGGNDWEAGMRGEEFTRACADAIERVRRATGGASDVLLVTTNPTIPRWKETAELAEACRNAARARHAGLADTDAAFRDAGKTDPNPLFVDDHVHLSRTGHALVTETVIKALEAGN